MSLPSILSSKMHKGHEEKAALMSFLNRLSSAVAVAVGILQGHQTVAEVTRIHAATVHSQTRDSTAGREAAAKDAGSQAVGCKTMREDKEHCRAGQDQAGVDYSRRMNPTEAGHCQGVRWPSRPWYHTRRR